MGRVLQLRNFGKFCGVERSIENSQNNLSKHSQKHKKAGFGKMQVLDRDRKPIFLWVGSINKLPSRIKRSIFQDFKKRGFH